MSHQTSSRKTNESISPTQTVNTWSRWQDDMEEDISFNTNVSKLSHTHKVPGTIEASHSMSYASIVAGQHQSNISSPTASRTGTHSYTVNELELENKHLRSRLQEIEGSQQSISTSSRASSKSKREHELETEVLQMKSLLAQQMAKFDGLEQKFDMLLRHMQPQATPQLEQNPTQRKQKSDKNLYKTSGGRRMHISNAGTTTPTSDPPDPGASQTKPIDSPGQMNIEDTTLEGGIHDDDLSEQMLQDWEESNSQTSDMSHSPEATRKKND